jgi:hypothetical protein
LLMKRLYSLRRDLEILTMPATLDTLADVCRRHELLGHLAVLTQPFLELILVGRKTIESRFSKVRRAPFEKVGPDDVLLLKEVCGPIKGLAAVSRVDYYGPLDPGNVTRIMRRFKEQLQINEQFVRAKAGARYGSLLHLALVMPTSAVRVRKTDRQAWVVLSARVGKPISRQPSLLPGAACMCPAAAPVSGRSRTPRTRT